jgi:antitoxin CcdA
MSLGYDRTVARKAFNLTLNPDLVRRARGLTRNLSGTIEALLAEFIEREHARRVAEDQHLNEVIDTTNVLHEKTGLLSDEFRSF